ncbi:MAG TPA: flippase activity-associated protein Agl23 [Anaerolineae bacterium]|nr:flippase activity-associated protein Agl23 [Anaerolineae bacterium]
MELQEKKSFFDRSLAELLKPDWEKAIYLLIFLLAIVSRFWDLGARAMSHDESLHALYSYYLYSGSGYVHNPMMHGPFLFHANALIYFLFGDDDFTARIVPALFGVFMVMSPLFLRRWLGRLGAIITAILLLISPSFLYYSRYIRNDIYIAVWTILLIAALFHFFRSHKPGWFYLGAAVLMFSLATKENAYIFGYIGLIYIIEVLLWERVRPRDQLWLYVGGAALSLILLVAAFLVGRPPAEGAEAAEAAVGVMKLVLSVLTVVGGTLPAMLISATLLRSRHPRPSSVEEAIRALSWQNWLIAVVIMFLIYALLFTTFFTNPLGLGTGIFGSISYWLAQQEVQRGGQPWYYYLLLLPMYEFVPLLFSLIATVYYVVRGRRPRPQMEVMEGDEILQVEEPRWGRSDARFLAFLIFWNIATLFTYSWAGEKMPWLVVHPVLPMIILSGKFAGDLLEEVDWREVWKRGGALLALLLPITLFGLYMLIKLQPFQGLSVFKLQETGNWLTALLVTLLLVILTVMVIRRLGGKYTLLVVVGTLLVGLSFFTVRFAWMAAYINYDYATELLVYAHGGADVKPTMDEIAEISQRTVGDKMIQVAYDSDVSWPLEWYMREYPNRQFYGETPTREKLDVPVVLAGDKNDSKAQPVLGDRYHRFKRRLVWWPNQEYMGLTWERIRDILFSPEKREMLWKILYFREYPRTPDDWYHVHNFYYYVRKDVAQQLWDYGAVPPGVVELPPDPYAEAQVEQTAVRVWGEVGTEPGQINHPRGVAVGPDGNVYVVDSDNHRVQVFDAEGVFLREWGSQCNLATELGCADLDGDGPMTIGDGQFQEPWGIAVADDGRVYVADTWNHRIQAFDGDGTFLTRWGAYGQTTDAALLMYGPRDIAVNSEGQVFVTDTGNKRILVFDQDGNYLDQWGNEGAGPGSFSEPVGIDLDAEGNIYVADTWNQRVQIFSPDHVFGNEWPVEAWYGQSVVNKPYLAVDGEGRVYITDPEGYRISVFSSEGELQATFGTYGFDDGSFSLPTGIDVDAEGYIYVTDTDGQRVMKFWPLP